MASDKIQSHVKGLIPIIADYFKGRHMTVKFNGVESTPRQLKGGGPQGCSMGILEYLSQTCHNLGFIKEDDLKYKYIDDATICEYILLKEVGLSTYNTRHHVPSDVPVNALWIPSENLQSQNHLNKIKDWTESRKMLLNINKTKLMIFNFNTNYKFSTRLTIDGTPLDILDEVKLLGTIIKSDLTWDANTNSITRRAYMRMGLLHKLIEFGVPKHDLILIYILFIRSICEQSAVVWHSSLTQEFRKQH